MLEVSMLIAREVYCQCPSCSKKVDGFLGDPRGTEAVCDDCNTVFKIATEADVDLI